MAEIFVLTIILILIYAYVQAFQRGFLDVYVCVCNGITENQIRDAVCSGVESLHDLGNELGVATCCGRCADCARQVIVEARAEIDDTALLQGLVSAA